MYSAYGLLQSDTDFDLGEAERRLRDRFPDFTITRTAEQISILKGDWELKLRVNDDPQVATESEWLADRIAGLESAEASAIEACERRVEVWSDSVDPFVEHLADFGATVEVLKTFRGLIAIDPKDHTLM